ncbi:hypothetical protein CPB84DRAFT_1857950 [Gymnopilus junonius]|uniref:Uncharacterized protein n=1 Tax=Gymnopilus junonius TaxID=109634 RepID=A0A9P5N8U0_GYMJU|nr:hypothetical protein CPB84DRAFT_1857950 [Gymnopilus junonius]
MAEDYPHVNMSVAQFCIHAKSILDAKDNAGFVKFVLMGIHHTQQAIVDPILDHMTKYEGLSIMCDYDSLLGIDRDIRVQSNLTVYPLAKREDTLQTNIHLKYTFESPDIRPFHCTGSQTLYSEERKPHLSQDEQRKFYEFGLRPAIQRIDPAQMTEWPVMYDDKMFCARGQSRTFSMQTKVTIDWMSQYLGEYIRDALESNGLDWGTGLVFLHQIRGIKNATTHSHTDAAAEESLVKFLKKNLLISPEADGYDELLQSGKWWIDVGVEVASDQE